MKIGNNIRRAIYLKGIINFWRKQGEAGRERVGAPAIHCLELGLARLGVLWAGE